MSRLRRRSRVARGEWETASRHTRRGKGQRPRESTLDLECPSHSGHRSGFGLGMQTCAGIRLNSSSERAPTCQRGPRGGGSSASGELGSGAHPLRGPGWAGAAGAAAPRRVAWGRPGGAPAGGALRSALGSPPRSPRPLSALGLAAGFQRVPAPSACAGPHRRRAVRHRRRRTGAGCGQRLPPARAQQPPPSRAAVRGRRGAVLGATLPEKPAGAASAPRSEF